MNPHSKNNRRHVTASRVIFYVLIAVLFGIALGYKLRLLLPENAPVSDLAAKTEAYPYLSRRIFIDNPNDVIINFINLRHYLREYVAKAEAGVPKLAVYFEYLPSGISIGINDVQPYLSASLLKVPLSMGIYKRIQDGQLTFEKSLTIAPGNVDKNSGTLWQKGAGAAVTVEEAVEFALIESDNTAKNLLISQLPLEEMNRVYEFLDIPTVNEGFSALISPKNYSSIFKSLYFSTYLSNDLSNRLLKHLTNAKFEGGIRAGVPPAVVVAHKYGIDAKPGAESVASFTSCGVVFLPKRPYLLCVMTGELPLAEAEAHVAHISRAIYEFTVSVKTD